MLEQIVITNFLIIYKQASAKFIKFVKFVKKFVGSNKHQETSVYIFRFCKYYQQTVAAICYC